MSPARKRRRGRTVLYVVALRVRGRRRHVGRARPPAESERPRRRPTRRRRCARRCGRRAGSRRCSPSLRPGPGSPADLARAVAPVRRVRRGRTTAPVRSRAIGGDRTLAPASTMKLLTAAAAIATLGPEYRFTTRVVRGPGDDLVVVGGGDPLLATPPYDRASSARNCGIGMRRTPTSARSPTRSPRPASGSVGALVVDDRRHDSLRFLPDWKPNYAPEGEVGALGALAVDGGFADLTHRTPAADPAIATGQQLAVLLGARGVTVAGGVRRGAAPRRRARSRARRLGAARRRRRRDAERAATTTRPSKLLREIAVRDAHGAPATTEMGAATVVRRARHARASRTAGSLMHDGSGLAPGDRVGCPTLLGVDRAHEPTALRGDRPRPAGRGPERHARGPLPRRSARGRAAGEDRVDRRRRRARRHHRRRTEPRLRVHRQRRLLPGGRAVPCRPRWRTPWRHIRLTSTRPSSCPPPDRHGPRGYALHRSRAARRDSCAVPGATSGLKWPTIRRRQVRELRELVVAYAKQETVEPIKGLGRYVGFGLGAGILIGLGRRCSSRSACCVCSRTRPAPPSPATGRGCRTRSSSSCRWSSPASSGGSASGRRQKEP